MRGRREIAPVRIQAVRDAVRFKQRIAVDRSKQRPFE
jgi:hypothetical protein